jgi:two-component system CheB/CheR fusion protein
MGSDLIDFPSSFYAPKSILTKKKISTKAVENIQAIANHILLQRFAPASVLVNEKGDIIYITGHTGKYLEPIAGKANWNIHAMAREGLQQVLPGAFRKARQTYDPIILRNIKVGTNGGTQFVDVTVQRIENPETIRGMVLVVFADMPVITEPEIVESGNGKRKSTGRIKELETELQRNYEELQSLREEMQASQEELKTTNEELQSTNEELQSSNEELMTSKEEMQSLNEELQTVNVELQSKITDFVRANDDMKNLLNSTEIATLFLDKELNIRRYTDQVTNIFKLRNADIGRPFTDLVSELNYPDIETHSRQVIKSLVSLELATQTHDGRWFNVRIMPYRTVDDRIDGLVLTFIDVTLAKRLEIELKEVNEELQKRKTT